MLTFLINAAEKLSYATLTLHQGACKCELRAPIDVYFMKHAPYVLMANIYADAG